MSESLVSVIVPCFRLGHLLPEALDSALAQSHPAIEVIAVNDGSDDDTREVAQGYGERVRLLEQRNLGPSAARNAGARIARGRYLLFLDADDVLHPEAVAWLVLATGGRDDRIGLMGFRRFTSEADRDSGSDELPSHGAKWFARLFDFDPLLAIPPVDLDPTRLTAFPYLVYTTFGPSLCWLAPRAATIDVGGFDETSRHCEDWDLWLRLAIAGCELACVDRAGGFYRSTPGSLSADSRLMLEGRARVWLRAAGARPEPTLHGWRRHLLQAGRRARRRFAAHGVRSPLARELSRSVAMLAASLPGQPPSVRWLDRLGVLGDRLVLAGLRRRRPDLHAYYRADID